MVYRSTMEDTPSPGFGKANKCLPGVLQSPLSRRLQRTGNVDYRGQNPSNTQKQKGIGKSLSPHMSNSESLERLLKRILYL
jgi:hypothetical protein